MTEKSHSGNLFFLLLACILILGAFIFIKTTPSGIGLVSDSVNYINGARSIAEGKGYYRESGGGTIKPITNFPPLYSILLSVPILFGAGGIQAAWAFSLIFYLLNITMIAILVRAVTKNGWLGLAGSLLFCASKPFLYFQVFAMSEPLFFFCTLMALYLLWLGFQTDSSIRWLLCGVFCGAAFLTRYVGVVSLAVTVGILLFLPPARVRRMKAIGWVLLGSVPLMMSWLIRNLIVSGNVTNREAYFHPLSGEEIHTGIMIFWRWIYPERYQNVTTPVSWMRLGIILIGIAGVLFLAGTFLLSVRKKDISNEMRMIWAFVLYLFVYLAVIFITITFLDWSVNIEERILFPCLMVMLLTLLTLIGIFLRKKKIFPVIGLLAVYGFLLITSSQDLIQFIPRFGEVGYGWAWQGWEDSPAMNLIKELPADTVIYSNQPEAVSLIAGRGAYALLDPIDPSTGLKRPGYDETMATIRNQVIQGEAVLVFFGINSWVEKDQENWITRLCEGLPYIYQDQSEWVVGKKEILK